jgi:hypothetical protein
MKFLISCFTFIFLSAHVVAQVSPYEVKAGSPLRKVILNVVRTPTESELGQKILFNNVFMSVSGNWAFVNGMLQQPNGKDPDPSKFKDKVYRENAEGGLFDNNFQAVLQKKKGKWTIVKRALGCTDVCWLEWRQKGGIPDALFPQ